MWLAAVVSLVVNTISSDPGVELVTFARLRLQAVILFAIPWSLGAVIDADGREKFDQFYRMILSGKVEDCPIPGALDSISVSFPENGQIYDYYYDV